MRTDLARPRLWMGVAFASLVSVTRSDGSGPAQLALALLLDVSGDSDVALEHYHEFKYGFVSRWPWPGGWTLSPAEAAAWIEERLVL